ncbi:MAG TPA: tetratricopeptide repeat protein [Chitinivibrionales bacterium]|nr:tetratricopeptide repeat protein [Chitinivibrionales bacterium]
MTAENRTLYHGPSCEDDEESEEGRVLSDAEWAQALNKRGDIFLIDKQRRLRNALAATLAAGVVCGVVLSTMQPVKSVPDIRRTIPEARMAKLLRGGVSQPSGEEKTGPIRRQENVPKRTEAVRLVKHAPARITLNADIRRTAAGQKPAAAVSEEDSIILRRGNGLKLTDHAGAIAEFRKVLGHDPHNAGALAGVADVFLYAGLLDSAAVMYEAAVAANPRSAPARNGLGTTRYYISTMAANPNYAARMNISDPKRYRQAQYDSAIADYTKAISLDSSYVQALTNRGVLREARRDFSAALEDYTLAIKIKPAYADAYAKRAATYKSLGRYKEAIADYTASIKCDSNTYEFNPMLHVVNAYFGRGNVYYQQGELDKAIADYDSALALDPNHSLTLINKGRALGDAKQYDSAIVCFTKAIGLLSPLEYDGVQEHAYFGRGLMYSLTGRNEMALKDFNDAIRMKPDDRFAYLHRGNIYKSHGSYDSAVADYKKSLESRQLAAKSCWRIAECFSLEKNRDDALVWLRKSIENGFTDVDAWKHDRDLSFLWNDKEFSALSKRQ